MSKSLTMLQVGDLVLHWGVRKGKQDWILPPKEMWTSSTQQVGDIAVENSFAEAGESVEQAGDRIALQSLQLQVNPAVDVTGITFVMRSEDNSAWYRDGKTSMKLANPCGHGLNFAAAICCSCGSRSRSLSALM